MQIIAYTVFEWQQFLIRKSMSGSTDCNTISPTVLYTYWLYNHNTLNRPFFISSRLPDIPLFELYRSQIIQLTCVFISPKLQLAGYLVDIIIPRYLGLVCKISRYLSDASSPARRLALCKNAEQNISSQFLKLDFQVSRSSLELMQTRLVSSGFFPKSEIASYLAISSWWRHA